MKYSLFLAFILSISSLYAGAFSSDTPKVHCVYSGTDGNCVQPSLSASQKLVVVTVFGQGVAPTVTASPAQAYALAKRAALADGYRQIAERIMGVHVEGQDTVKNMMLQRSTVSTSVDAMVRGANIVDTTFKDGLCEVELEIVLSYSQF
ncbi:MAG: LPP20 family lipoprotein [Campylobacterales bacterium]|nr:LPP20 family lipoprotein [Campylobacterales bacterium]